MSGQQQDAGSKSSIEKGVYRHTKSGKLYEVIGTALHTETEELLVVYRPQYTCDYELFVRPYAMFTESVTFDDITQMRFEKLS